MAAKTWSVYRTRFHGGGLVSRHRSRARAEQAARKYRVDDCVCGCAVVVDPGVEVRRVDDGGSPYEPARR